MSDGVHQSRWWLSATGGMALVYCLAVLSVVMTSPDVRLRWLLVDSDRGSSNADPPGIVIRRTPGLVAAELCPEPQAGDRLERLRGEPVRSFFDLTRLVSELRHAREPEGQLYAGANIHELLGEEGTRPLLRTADGRQWVEAWFRPEAAAESTRTYLLVQNLPLKDVVLTLVWFLLQLGIFGVSALAVWHRPFDRRARLFFAMCIVTLLAFIGGFHWWLAAGSPWLNVPFVAAALLLPVISLHFFMVHPQRKPLLQRRPRLVLWLYTVPAIGLVLFVTLLSYARWLSGVPVTAEISERLVSTLEWLRVAINGYLLFTGASFIAMLAALAHGFLKTGNPIERSQMKWMFWAGILASVPVTYTLVLALSGSEQNRAVFALDWTTRLAMFLASLSFMLAYAVGIIRFRLMLLEQIVSRGMVYYLASVVLAVVFGSVIAVSLLIIDSLNLELAPHQRLQTVLAVGVILVLIVLILLWLRDRWQQQIDRRFYREKYQLHKALERINEAVVQVGDRHSLAERMLGSCRDVFQIDAAALYLSGAHRGTFRLVAVDGAEDIPLQFSLDDAALEALRQGSPISQGSRSLQSQSEATIQTIRRLKADLLHGLDLDGEISGLVVLGTKRDGAGYSAEDLTFLHALGQITSVALHGAKVHQDVTRLNEELQGKVDTISEQRRQITMMQAELANWPVGPEASETVVDPGEFRRETIIGNSPAIREVLETVRKVARSESSVLIQGPSGTGKELVAQMIHDNSPRSEGPLVQVHCAALSPSLLESELFGHVRGAFTGAHRDRIGRFEMANGGTLFLDEIGDISLETQIKLLRVLQSRSFEPVGGTRSIEVDVRLLTATNQDLKQLIVAGRFREDLFYRINVISITLPSLAERTEDIEELALYFLQRAARRLGQRITKLDENALQALQNHSWPGNIRELENAIERAVVLAEGPRVRAADLPEELISRDDGRTPAVVATSSANPVTTPTKAFESDNGTGRGRNNRPDPEELRTALDRAGGNKSRAATLLGLPRSTFFSQLKKFGID